MVLVINSCYGGFDLPREFCEMYDRDDTWVYDIERDDPKLVSYVRENGGRVKFGYSELECVTIPDNATDWEMDEYDGYETITYVVDGKIHHT